MKRYRPATRNCPTCGAPLPGDANPRRRYCSAACKQRRNNRDIKDRERQAKQLVRRHCKHCKEVFQPDHLNQLHCSRACGTLAAKAAYRLRRKRRPAEMTCACGAVYPVPTAGGFSPRCAACRKARRLELEATARRRRAIAPLQPRQAPAPRKRGPRDTEVAKAWKDTGPVAASPCASCEHGRADGAADTGWVCALWAAGRCKPLAGAVLWKAKEARA